MRLPFAEEIKAAQAAGQAAPGASGAAPDAAALAGLAQAFAQRLDRLPEALDASWHEASRTASLVAGLPPGEARRRVMLRLFERWCGPLPALTALATPAGGLGLLERQPLLTRLCALALLGRPGALRCCVERRTRQALQQALGPVFDALVQCSQGGAPVAPAAAQWSPLEWACAGYADLALARAWPQRSLRRLARLALPTRWPIARSAAALPPAQLSAPLALRRLDALFAG
ncbi:MAG TPA: type III secretion protein HrpB4 [Burkholderiaceae bacterium]|nr:type III secretion protein HrpB4 [Burkholderiaceae bacterium]